MGTENRKTTKETAEGLLRFIEKSPTAFHAVREIAKMLQDAGFRELSEGEQWNLLPGEDCFVTRNGSSLIAFRLPGQSAEDAGLQAGESTENTGFQIIASHSDSPSFKIKENPEIRVENSYIKLNVEKYGGMLFAPWFDRPLSAAGRIIVEREGRLYSRLADVDKDLLVIPNVAIHMNRKVNEGFAYDPKKDLLPLYGMCGEGTSFLGTVAEAAGEKEEDLRGMDLFLYNRQKGTVWGPGDCFISAPRLDDLECAYASVLGLIGAKPGRSIAVSCIFDNEEVGSATKQGAASTFLKDTLKRILASCGRRSGCAEEDFVRAISRSFMISADNAHALHPNHPELSDPVNRPVMNRGIVIKHNASQKYTTDGVSAALMRMMLKKAGLKYQEFLNRSDMAGGSTLGNISGNQVALKTVDIGLPQLAMHSPYETAGTRDLMDLVTAAEQFYALSFIETEDGGFGWN
ncbi:MAG: M18 family aminopeptidase [Stomatobaculum sp.]|nr:M18 family aminopeptidase [Stomatobaculum sp.]